MMHNLLSRLWDNPVVLTPHHGTKQPWQAGVKSYIELLPEARLALLSLALLLLLCGLVQLFHSVVDICCIHSGGVIRLPGQTETERDREGKNLLIEMKDKANERNNNIVIIVSQATLRHTQRCE